MELGLSLQKSTPLLHEFIKPLRTSADVNCTRYDRHT